MNRKHIILLSIVALALIIIGVVVYMDHYRLSNLNYESPDGEKHGIYVYPEECLDTTMAHIGEVYTLASPRAWRRHARKAQFTAAKPGYYLLPEKMGDRLLIRRLQYGEQTPVHLSFTNSVRTREQLSRRLARQLLLDSASIMERLDSIEYLRQYGLNRETAVCMFIPNTYDVYWTTTPDQLFERMNREYHRFWNEERIAQAAALGMTPTEVSTLASIAESETNKAFEYPIIASLYMNRLKKGMPLQACPTVIFAWQDFGMRRVLSRHLKIDSPYNTYKYRGLPPGPIRLARAATMDSVLHAKPTQYLYMCANPDFSATHVFTSSYAQHSAVAKQYQRELNKRHIKK